VARAGSVSSFLEAPHVDQAPTSLIGRRLGPYDVIDRLGAGGMGEVYRARDTRLGRDVAIKTLPHDRLADPSRRRRFIQEARAASALNHPNIVTIHEIETIDGVDLIVMELVLGKSLSELIGRRMTLAEVLRLAIPIADAVARAHAAGIVHRDLKPANIMVSAEGLVKILDFGLAKLVDREEQIVDPTTVTAPVAASSISLAGAIVGTPAYMSPEQATGADVDARSDIFSFGAVLYEMVTARRAFSGNSTTETLGAVVHLEPRAPSELARGVPSNLERVILRCLRKDPSRRVQHMADLKVELLDLKEELDAHVVSVAPPSGLRRSLLIAGVTAVLALGVMTWAVFMRGSPVATPRLMSVTTAAGSEAMPSVSPDGDSVAFSWEGESRADGAAQDRDIWVTLIGASENRQLTSGPDDDWSPSWSPDGRRIAFVRVPPRNAIGRGAIYVVSPLGGPARRIGAATPVFSQLSWSPDARWIAAPGYRIADDESSKAGGIQLIPVDGGAARSITVPRESGYDAFPAFSSDGRRLAYSSCEKEITPPCDVFVVDLTSGFQPSGPPRQVTHLRGPIHGIAWAPDERSIVFAFATMSVYGSGLGSQLWRASIDGDRPPERVEAAPWGSFGPSLSRSRHRLVFAQDHTDIDIFRFDGANPPKPVTASSFVDYAPSFSPDGGRIAFESSRSGVGQEIWLADPDGTNAVQVTRSTPGSQGRLTLIGNGNPNWSPDGRRIVFTSHGENSEPDLFTVDPDGGGRRQVTNDAYTDALATWSHDGRWIYYRQDRPEGRNIVRIPSDGGSPQPLTTGGALYPIESWDETTLLFTKTEETSPLYTMPAAGGDEQRLIDCVMSRALAVTPPNNLYYLGCTSGASPVTVHRRDLTTGRDEVLGTIDRGPRNVFLGLAVSPDGKTILYARFVAGGSDLMMLENFR
jgi:serine/threonine protein kinase/Tol biopolymer transport system component